MWFQVSLKQLVYNVLLPNTIYCNTQSCIAMTKNPSFHAWTTYVDVQYHNIYAKAQWKIKLLHDMFLENKLKANIIYFSQSILHLSVIDLTSTNFRWT